jgi:cytochrome b561
MPWLDEVSYFCGGIFLTNAIPHFVSGVMGRPFQSPFAKPPGKGLSSSTINVLWGVFNLVLGYLLIGQVGTFDPRATKQVIATGLGILLGGIVLARMFGRLHGGNNPAADLVTDFHSSLTAVQWVASGYLLALTLALPMNGWLVDRIGAKVLYLWCFSAFTFCST